jgi:hypothetical protein
MFDSRSESKNTNYLPLRLTPREFYKDFSDQCKKQWAVREIVVRFSPNCLLFLFFTLISYTITSHSLSVSNKGITMRFYR